MASLSYVKNVAIVGAGGNVGRYMTESLLATGKHTITAITREGSTTEFPAGVHSIKKFDYENPATIVEALKGQDALVITLGSFAPHDAQEKLIDAAIEAGVSFIMPNEWGPDTYNEALVKDVFIFAPRLPIRERIATKGKGTTSFIAMSTGFWYEWSLAIPSAFGFDFAKNTATFFDDGKTITNMSTWPQVGRAVAALLSLPIENTDAPEKSLSHYKNKPVYISSFEISQADMLESALRVTCTKESDWTISYEKSEQRFAENLKAMQGGDREAFVKTMVS